MNAETVMVTARGLGLPPDECPFPGLSSYALTQHHSFRGRQRETLEFARTILSQRMTILTAGSGDGKTSLLHAGLLPLLLRDRVEVAVAEPGAHAPVAAIAGQLLRRLVPLSAHNLEILGALKERSLGETLRDARERFTRDRTLTRDLWPLDRPLDALARGPLQSWLTLPDMPDQLLNCAMDAVARQQTDGAVSWPGVTAPLDEAIRFFEAIPAEVECAAFDLATPPDQLKKLLLKRLDRAFGLHARQHAYEIVFVVDQLEELFVQYRGSRADVQQDSPTAPLRHKRAALDLLKAVAKRRSWPVRLVLSLRKEHYAELDSEVQAGFGATTHCSTYHLAPLSGDQALACLRDLLEPERDGDPRADAAKLLTWTKFSDTAVASLGAGNEGGWVDATQLSALGTSIWKNPLPENVEAAIKGALVAQVEAVLGLPAQLSADVSRARPAEAPTLIETQAQQQEAFDILAQLRIPSETGGGRRISLPRGSLEARHWRSQSFRSKMIDRLCQANLIRRDKRNEEDYYEIVHERLIDVIEQLRQRWRDPLYSELDPILDFLRSSCTLDPFAPLVLAREQFDTLEANRERLALTDFAASRLIEATLASSQLWQQSDGGLSRTGGFLEWLAEQAKSETDSTRCIDPDDPEGRRQLAERALLAWRWGEIASPALADSLLAARPFSPLEEAPAGRIDDDRRSRSGIAADARTSSSLIQGLEDTALATWLLISSLFHNHAEDRVQGLAGYLTGEMRGGD